MESLNLFKHLCLLTSAVVTTLVMTGCATTMDDDQSELPWNTPQQWEGSPSIPGLSDR